MSDTRRRSDDQEAQQWGCLQLLVLPQLLHLTFKVTNKKQRAIPKFLWLLRVLTVPKIVYFHSGPLQMGKHQGH